MILHPFYANSLIVYFIYSMLTQLFIIIIFCVIEIAIVNFQINTHNVRTLQSASEISHYLGSQ